MWQIARGLSLGDGKDAHDRDLLLGRGITHVLNCAREVPCWYPTDFRYLHLRLRDPDPSFTDHIERICTFIRRGRRGGGGVLVHCFAGLSRSPSAILAYICSRGKSLDDALDLLSRRVGEGRNFIEPDPVFLEQIEQHFFGDDL